jgi:hypothetical protein
MMMQRQVFASLLLGGAVVFVLGLGALAQSVSLTVTAYSDAVRFSAQGSVKELRVEILSRSQARRSSIPGQCWAMPWTGSSSTARDSR